MANYEGFVRTNYFRVKDEEQFRELMSKVVGEYEEPEVWTREGKNGETFFAFGCYGEICGLRTNPEDENYDEDYDESFDAFIDGLQNCVAEDDAIIIYESGHEKLRYLIGSATIITSTQTKYCDIRTYALDNARKLLKNENFDTVSDY